MILPIALGDKRANPKYRIALELYDGTNKDCPCSSLTLPRRVRVCCVKPADTDRRGAAAKPESNLRLLHEKRHGLRVTHDNIIALPQIGQLDRGG